MPSEIQAEFSRVTPFATGIIAPQPCAKVTGLVRSDAARLGVRAARTGVFVDFGQKFAVLRGDSFPYRSHEPTLGTDD